VTLRQGHPLLAGADTERDRRARRRLVRELLAAGVPESEVLRAVEEDRLALLPAEVVLDGKRHYKPETLERLSGLSVERFEEFTRAAGLATPAEIRGSALNAAKALARLEKAGLDWEGILEVTRVAGQGLSSIARAMVRLAGETYIEPGDSEYELGARYAEAANQLLPLLPAILDHQLRVHLRDALRQQTVGESERARGRVSHSRPMAIAFADLVGFTRLGTRVHADEVGRVAARLVEIAVAVVHPPVQMVKSVGDAVMLASTELVPLIEETLKLVDAVAAEGEHFPQLRAGIAYGHVVASGGDWYGHAVNMASRLTAVARPGSVVASSEVRRMTQGHITWSQPLPHRVRGMRGPVFVARVRSVDNGD
jgi:adenylate cyclase